LPTWGSPRIQAERAKLGIRISDSTVRKYRPNHRRPRSAQTWKTFLHNHAKELVAIDFFTVPTANFRVLYVLLVLAHERRRVLHFNITNSPSAAWMAQQVVEAFPFTTPPRRLFVRRTSLDPRCSFRYPQAAVGIFRRSTRPPLSPTLLA